MTNKKPIRKRSAAVEKMLQNRDARQVAKIQKQMLLAAKIQDALKDRSISKKRFAEMMDQYPSVVSKWLSGTHHFTTDTLFDIEEKLGICLVSLQEEPQKVVVTNSVFVVMADSKSMTNRHYTEGNKSRLINEYFIMTASTMPPGKKMKLPVLN